MPQEEVLLMPMKFHNRINKYAIVPFHFMMFFEHGNLRELIENHRMKGLDELHERFSPGLYANTPPHEANDLMQQMRDKFRETVRVEVNEYLPILYNQALVLMVTVFDVFLYEAMRTLITKEPNVLKTMADEKDMNIIQIVDLRDYQKIVETIQDRVLRRFDYKNINEKVEALRKLRVDVDAAFGFRFHNETVQRKYSDSLALLRDYYNKRHAIVHREQAAFDSYQQLENAGSFLQDLVMSLAFAIGFRFGIFTDWERFSNGSHPQRPKLPMTASK